MTPAAIIREAQAEGVRLALSPTGTIKATGDGAAVNRWLAVIREHKAEIIDVLKVCAGDTAAIRRWLAHIGETDPVIIAGVLGKCQHDADARAYFIGRSNEASQ